MWYYLIVNEQIVACSTEREIVALNQEEQGQGTIIESSDYYSETDFIYSNGAFSTRTKPIEELKEERRIEREEKFMETLDMMNGAWYDTLSAQQKTDLATWRQAWLDYPSTGTKPDDLDLFG